MGAGMAGSKWDAVQMAPADPILGVAIAYKQDPSANKVRLVRNCAHTHSVRMRRARPPRAAPLLQRQGGAVRGNRILIWAVQQNQVNLGIGAYRDADGKPLVRARLGTSIDAGLLVAGARVRVLASVCGNSCSRACEP